MNEPSAVRALKAPRRTGEALVAPPQSTVAALLQQNARSAETRFELLGRPLAELARAARAHMLEAAIDYTRQYRDVSPHSATPSSFLLAGHQPELFHPGVWFKNFLLDRLAREHQAVAINLVIDHDACRLASIRVPTGSVEYPAVVRAPFDAPAAVVPWEERAIVDRGVFESFAARAERAIRPLVPSPLVSELWPLAIAAANRGESLGAAIAQARHAFEGQLGLQTLEVPLSHLCRGEAFAWFAAWLFTEAARVRAVYNRAVQEYRKANHVRSASHPVPDLAMIGDYCESPLWVWSKANPRRRHVFVARSTRGLTLTDREGWSLEVPGVSSGSPLPLVERLLAFDAQGVRLRPRALTTTWYARVVLSDLFIHGIGGAKYDEVTDRIIGELFGIDPPAFITATATLRLPVALDNDAEDQLRKLKTRRRELRFHPERLLELSGDGSRAAVAEKTRCIAAFRQAASQSWHRQTARELHEAMSRANAAFAPWTEAESLRLDARERQLTDQARAKQVLESREYAFCLFPREAVVPSLMQLASGPA